MPAVPRTAARRLAAQAKNHPLLHFTPNWFAMTMGTGIVAIALGQFPQAPLLHEAGAMLWLFNIGLFGLCTFAYLAKWVLYPRAARALFSHPVASMFLGCIPMGLATIVNGLLSYGMVLFGPGAVSLAVYVWIVDALLSVVIGLAVPFMMFTRQDHVIQEMSAVWLLPVVACEVAAVSACLLMPHVADAGTQLGLLVAGMVLWACSVPLALGILVILFLRLVLHKLPPSGMAATSWLALGPVGTGALALALMAGEAEAVLAANGLSAYGNGLAAGSLLGAILLWGYGLWWMAMAIALTLRYLRQGMPFNIGWWGFTFPLGVYTVATLKLAALLGLAPLARFGEGLTVALVLIWMLVIVRTLRGAFSLTLFEDPSLKLA